jgi:hypothetical protein
VTPIELAATVVFVVFMAVAVTWVGALEAQIKELERREELAFKAGMRWGLPDSVDDQQLDRWWRHYWCKQNYRNP